MDARIRDLERATEDGDQSARYRLTRELLRARTGIVACWPTSAPPHPSAAKLTSEWTTKHPTDGRVHVHRTHGWALALSSLQDAMEVSRLARQATLFDLATGRWARLTGRRTQNDLEAVELAEQPTTTDALGRPRATVRPTTRAGVDFEREGRVDGSSWGRFVEEPIYDTEWLEPTEGHWWQIRTFRNYHAFTSSRRPRDKMWGIDTNMAGGNGGMPNGMLHDAAGLTLEVFGEGEGLTDLETEALLKDAMLSFNLTASRFLAVPALHALRPRVAGDGEAWTVHRPEPPMIPFAWPLRLGPLEDFNVELMGTNPVPRGVFVKVTIHGFQRRGLAA